MEERNKGLIIFGIVLLAIGLGLSLYDTRELMYPYDLTYPYQTIGMVLIVAGIVFIALGFLYSPRKMTPPPTNPQQQKIN